MAMRAAALRLGVRRLPLPLCRGRFFSDGSGRVLGEEERAAENMYIKKMEKEKLEKAARQGVKSEEPAATSFNSEPHSTPVTEMSTDSTKNIAVVAGIVAIVAAGWWYMRSSSKPKEEEKE